MTARGPEADTGGPRGGSYLSANAPELHFGLGPSTKADKIEIRWPDGRAMTLLNVAADHAYQITPERSPPDRCNNQAPNRRITV